MILTGSAIEDAVTKSEIHIDPFDASLTNPNSYNYRLGPTLRVTTDDVADPFSAASFTEFEIPESGCILVPGRVYLGTTVEKIGSSVYVTSLIGRSSLGRVGLFLQVSADLGQLGAVHRWTLEIVATQPIRVYPGMVVGQVSFWKPYGDTTPYRGYYGHRSDAAPCNPAAMTASLTAQGGEVR
ncbi:deoxycytidine deaminase [Planosporangium flavigriseum]|uniref:dCTP deaminase n=1 Tax=Planosporangium flavigriseum TaxID=373681 RepID=A0A8J3PP59_9ACTN|nr:deoxycytidine deaminase [Planosporangium flavigriseum]NJC67493.1 deoxycytidine deaminase [Planosporangium flavigriseum]GIG75558.1 hypothetical protein Pfl04_39620 [Planosporangium flavigriseum]